MLLLQALNWRYAVREFSETKIPHSQLEALVEATRLSASSYGLQPYRLMVIGSRDIREQLLQHSYGQEKVLESSYLIVLAAETEIGDHTVDRYADAFSKERRVPFSDIQGYVDHMKSALAAKTDSQKRQWAREQAYIALGNLLTSAAILGIDSCPMTGFDSDGYDQVLGFKDKALQATAIVAIGERSPNDQSWKGAKIRKPRDKFVTEL